MDIEQRRRFSDEQKMGAILLFVFALVAVGLGALQLRNTIYGPFVIHPASSGTPDQLFAGDRTRLQKIDTDHDGLNDYEELEFYGTSPYLPDTDSDGMKDKAEIQEGTDPTCADGQLCGTETAVDTGSSILVPVIGQDSGIDLLGGAVAGGSADAAGAARLNLESLANNPSALRKLLLESGKLNENDLKDIDDATLIELAKNILKQTATSTP